MENRVKTVLLLAGLTAFLVFMGKVLGGRQGMYLAFVLALGMNFFSYWFSDKIVLRMYGAQEVSPAEAPELHRMVDDLAREAGIPKPKVYLIPDDSPNAFATGRNPEHAAVAATQGIMRILTPEELQGVLGHELGPDGHRPVPGVPGGRNRNPPGPQSPIPGFGPGQTVPGGGATAHGRVPGHRA